jgi:hypothetical protein
MTGGHNVCNAHARSDVVSMPEAGMDDDGSPQSRAAQMRYTQQTTRFRQKK